MTKELSNVTKELSHDHQIWEKKRKKGTTICDKRIVKCDVRTVQCDSGTVKCKKKNKGIAKCEKITVKCNVGTAQCEDGTVKCKKKVREPPNVTKELSYVILELHNVRMEPSSMRKK